MLSAPPVPGDGAAIRRRRGATRYAGKRLEEIIEANPAFRALNDQMRAELGLDDSDEAQRQAGLRALRSGEIVRGQQDSASSSKREGKP